MQVPPISSVGVTCLLVVILVALVSISRVCLGEYARHARWHDLRVRCQRMRRERLMAMLAYQAEQEALASKRSVPLIRPSAADGDQDEDGADDRDGVAGRIEPAAEAPARRAA